MSDFESWLTNWMDKKNWKPQKFQSDTWKAVLSGYSGLVNAPTGSGKTLSLLPPILWPNKDCSLKTNVFCIWITPLRSLSQQIRISMEEFIDENNLNLTVGIRNGDTPQKIRNLQRKKFLLKKSRRKFNEQLMMNLLLVIYFLILNIQV